MFHTYSIHIPYIYIYIYIYEQADLMLSWKVKGGGHW